MSTEGGNKTKVSIAARELAMRLFASDHGMSHMDKLPQFDTLRSRHQIVIEKYEAIVQSALADLLEKAERREWLLRRIMEDLPSKRDWLDPTLEREAMDSTLAANIAPWKTPI